MVWAGVCEGKKRVKWGGNMLDSGRSLPGIYCEILDQERTSEVNPQGSSVWCRDRLNWISWGMGTKPWEVLLGFCLGPGLGQPLWAPHQSENFLFSTAVTSYLSSSFWALHSVLLQMGELIDWEGFVAVIRIETCNIFMSTHTFCHGFYPSTPFAYFWLPLPAEQMFSESCLQQSPGLFPVWLQLI